MLCLPHAEFFFLDSCKKHQTPCTIGQKLFFEENIVKNQSRSFVLISTDMGLDMGLQKKIVLVLLSTSVERVGVFCMRDFFKINCDICLALTGSTVLKSIINRFLAVATALLFSKSVCKSQNRKCVCKLQNSHTPSST